ncbi:DNA-binding response regulator [Chryseobacterium nematophagum]|uniref:DNA-binding response regulator n=1 Tax=Chryseobacterium nematophagum TaxID=2305228 RepID=A0A3M7TIG5_9FLAO|nr:LuxR C-terminal-related transcriptional regulator [Chryseobacterium nematophagum]RNA63343.1 DNA-binding response regulator [Chryseobacterium nematophagum]
MKKKILIADSLPIVVLGLTTLLKSSHSVFSIESVYTLRDLLEVVVEKPYDYLIVDLHIFGADSKSNLRTIKDLNPELKVAIFMDSKNHLEGELMLEEVVACLYKDNSREDLDTAFTSLFTQGYYYSQELLYHFLQTKNMGENPLTCLSEREREVYFHLIRGGGVLEIANALGVAQSSVSTFKKRLFKKLHINSLVELIQFHNHNYQQNSFHF